MSTSKYLNVGEVAARFGVTKSTVYRLVQNGKLPGFKLGGQWRFSTKLLDAWAMEQASVERSNSGRQGH